ncbi:MAG: uracil-xanthine permease [Firmicutes bacterium]|uniref:Uracil-xanthine permease n=1 Tax=Candidatus Stercoripulliclostridium pullicola TaxID=2840953 RepID=A0A940DHZ5_9FIRM|nr:uracil-xanthine permease [Candidatus Stercoripulliclostridium pullicola]
MKLIYDVNDRPPFGKLIAFSIQQLLAIITATIAVPIIVGSDVLTPAAALLGAGFGTICYLLFTKFRSPVFLGSSFAFIAPLTGAVAFGYFGVLLGAAFAATVYIVIAIVIKLAGTKWINKLMPPVVIGPTVALIGFSLAGNAMGDIVKASGSAMSYNLVGLLCGLITFFVIVFCSVQGNKSMKLIPFIIGIAVGYVVASLFSIIGYVADVDYLKIVDYSAFKTLFEPVRLESFINYDFSFLHTKGYETLDGAGVANIALLYIPVTFVVFAEHIADHKNISSIIERDLITDPGLHRTLLGDGVGSFVGAVFGGCPNTTYGESIGCVAITRNASVVSILGAAVLAIVLAFCAPVIAFINTIPSCVMGGVCLSLYGFIAVSGLNMLRGIDLGESKNLFVVSSILIAGIGGLTLHFGTDEDGNAIITISSIATALILGVLVNLFVKAPAIPEKGDSLPSAHVEASKTVSENAKETVPAEGESFETSETAESEAEVKE